MNYEDFVCLLNSEEKSIFAGAGNVLIITNTSARIIPIVQPEIEEEAEIEEETEPEPNVEEEIKIYESTEIKREIPKNLGKPPTEFGFATWFDLAEWSHRQGNLVAAKHFKMSKGWVQQRVQIYKTIVHLEEVGKTKEAGKLREKFEETPVGALRMAQEFLRDEAALAFVNNRKCN